MTPELDSLKENRCIYCSKILEEQKWSSRWDQDRHDIHHYKSIVCECGKHNWVKVDFDGSGHDSVFKKEINVVESSVPKVAER
jgi:hypothetical protein